MISKLGDKNNTVVKGSDPSPSIQQKKIDDVKYSPLVQAYLRGVVTMSLCMDITQQLTITRSVQNILETFI